MLISIQTLDALLPQMLLIIAGLISNQIKRKVNTIRPNMINASFFPIHFFNINRIVTLSLFVYKKGGIGADEASSKMGL